MRQPTIKSDVCNFLKYTPMLFNGGKQTDASDKRKHIHIMSSTTIACFPLYIWKYIRVQNTKLVIGGSNMILFSKTALGILLKGWLYYIWYWTILYTFNFKAQLDESCKKSIYFSSHIIFSSTFHSLCVMKQDFNAYFTWSV